MASERLYSESEAVDIIQRALDDPTSELPATGLTKDDLWRIAEEAGATRDKFESALASTRNKESLGLPNPAIGTQVFSRTIQGELSEGDLIIVEESLPVTFGGKVVENDGRSLKARIDVGTGHICAVVSSRKGQTSVRVHTVGFTAVLAGCLTALAFAFGGLMTMMSGTSRVAWLLFPFFPLFGIWVSTKMTQKLGKLASEVFEQITSLVSNTVATSQAESLRIAQQNGTSVSIENSTPHLQGSDLA